MNFYQVGGCIRDKFLGIKSKDIDFAVEAKSFNEMRDWILSKGGRIFLEKPEFFTIIANVPDIGAADFVLCRKDGEYKDGRHPETVEVGTIYDDLARRDFTMNAIALNQETGKMIDPYNGYTDIQNRIIRCVGNARDRFTEDALRIFRALRFSITKSMDIDSEILCELAAFDSYNFTKVSTERIREELKKMFEANSFQAFGMLVKYPQVMHLVRSRGIWFKPTTEKN